MLGRCKQAVSCCMAVTARKRLCWDLQPAEPRGWNTARRLLCEVAHFECISTPFYCTEAETSSRGSQLCFLGTSQGRQSQASPIEPLNLHAVLLTGLFPAATDSNQESWPSAACLICTHIVEAPWGNVVCENCLCNVLQPSQYQPRSSALTFILISPLNKAVSEGWKLRRKPTSCGKTPVRQNQWQIRSWFVLPKLGRAKTARLTTQGQCPVEWCACQTRQVA